MNPSVGQDEEVRRLHAKGLTGLHVGIVVIDWFLLTEHREYADRLRWYDEIDAAPWDTAKLHGTAVASIAAGRTVGVAPEADLYFTGLGINYGPIGDLFVTAARYAHTGMPHALAIRRILEMNRHLEPGRKIRVISMSMGFGPNLFGLNQTRAAIAEARRAGIFVSTIDLGFAPIGPVNTASPLGPEAYTTQAPAVSWAIAYWAGRYALACQEDPSITPERFLKKIPPVEQQ
jgi:subtilisin family serine protease